MSSSPIVTVVIPTRNRSELLRRSVASVLAQTVADFELIVVDDGSDEPVRAADLAHDDRLTLLRHDRPVGVCSARNVGMHHARGRWITFLDDDDELLPDTLQVCVDAARSSTFPPPVAVLSGIEVVNSVGTVLETRVPISVKRGDSFFRSDAHTRTFQDANSLFAPVDVMRSIGGWDEAYRAWETDDLFLRLSQVSSIQGVARATYRLRVHEGGRLHQDGQAMIEGALRTLTKHRQAFAADPQRHARYLRALGLLYLRAGAWWPAMQALVRATRLDPRWPRSWHLYVRAILVRVGATFRPSQPERVGR